MPEESSKEQEQAQIDAALDAALDELDDSDDDDVDIPRKKDPVAVRVVTPPPEEKKHPDSDGKKAAFIGPPRPPPKEDDPERLLADMMQHLSMSPPSTGDADSDAFLGQFMQEMQNQIESHITQEDSAAKSIPSNGDSPATQPRSKPKPTIPSNKSPNRSQVDKAISALVEDMAKPVEIDDTTPDDDPLKGLMGDLNMPGFNPDEMVEGMMQELLSKELMYEPMKQVATKFPDWLKERRDSLPQNEYQKRKRQCECFQQLVHVYENDPENSQRLMTLMQDVQEYGQPPNEIIQEIAPGLELDEEGMPKLDAAGFNEECRIM